MLQSKLERVMMVYSDTLEKLQFNQVSERDLKERQQVMLNFQADLNQEIENLPDQFPEIENCTQLYKERDYEIDRHKQLMAQLKDLQSQLKLRAQEKLFKK
ncbi:hypothetical protein pb186bvf_007395 [Paramecium bursaria]